ncbi:hypothetical protein AN958_02796 [Leucoagaricus sp. SymC.cos]|nr:hypothetical protein AN958_02796 [Leucoagaricus sp. SymC.cos]
MSILVNGRVAQSSTIRAGLNIVRKVFANNDLSKGVSTHELYQLALREPIPEGFKGDPRLTAEPGGIKGITLPPHNEHPIRSKVFLKNNILPALVGSGEIVKVVSQREITFPVHLVKKGKVRRQATRETAGASPENPVTVKAWVWRPTTDQESMKRLKMSQKAQAANKSRTPPAEDFSHLNKRRQKTREEKLGGKQAS